MMLRRKQKQGSKQTPLPEISQDDQAYVFPKAELDNDEPSRRKLQEMDAGSPQEMSASPIDKRPAELEAFTHRVLELPDTSHGHEGADARSPI